MSTRAEGSSEVIEFGGLTIGFDERVLRPRPWTAEQSRRFLAVAGRSAYGPIWAVYLGSGMRRGEALGLRWRDVDLQALQGSADG